MEETTFYQLALQYGYTLRANECKKYFYQFLKEFWHVVCAEKYTYNFHIKKLCRELQAAGERIINREAAEEDIIINISPGETKTIICSIMFPAWLLTNDPSSRFLGSSHTYSLSEYNALMTLEILESEHYTKLFGKFELNERKKGQGDFITKKNGRRKATAVGSRVAGSHYHCIVFDDPIDAQGELSAKEMKDAKNHMTKCWSRKVDEKITLFILVQQRVAENDTTPFFKTLSNRKVKHIRLPATDDFPVYPPSWKKYYKDGVMNPKRKTREDLAAIKKKTPLVFNAQYGQQPSDLKGKVVKRTDFIIKKLSEFPLKYFAIKNKIVADTAYTENKKNDPSGFLICTYKDSFLYLLDFFEEWLELPEAVDRLEFLMATKGCDAVHIENKASGTSIAQTVRKMKALNAIDYQQTMSDKKARLVDALPMPQAKRVIIVLDDNDPEQRERMEYFITCVTQFPSSTIHDEAVDTLVMAINLSIQADIIRSWN